MTLSNDVTIFVIIQCIDLLIYLFLAPLPNLTTEDIDKALAPPLSHQTNAKVPGSNFPRTTEGEKRPCSPSIGGYSRSVPVARADGSEYLASCA